MYCQSPMLLLQYNQKGKVVITQTKEADWCKFHTGLRMTYLLWDLVPELILPLSPFCFPIHQLQNIVHVFSWLILTWIILNCEVHHCDLINVLLLSSKDVEYPNKNRNEDRVGPVMLNGLLLPLDRWKQHDLWGKLDTEN